MWNFNQFLEKCRQYLCFMLGQFLRICKLFYCPFKRNYCPNSVQLYTLVPHPGENIQWRKSSKIYKRKFYSKRFAWFLEPWHLYNFMNIFPTKFFLLCCQDNWTKISLHLTNLNVRSAAAVFVANLSDFSLASLTQFCKFLQVSFSIKLNFHLFFVVFL